MTSRQKKGEKVVDGILLEYVKVRSMIRFDKGFILLVAYFYSKSYHIWTIIHNNHSIDELFIQILPLLINFINNTLGPFSCFNSFACISNVHAYSRTWSCDIKDLANWISSSIFFFLSSTFPLASVSSFFKYWRYFYRRRCLRLGGYILRNRFRDLRNQIKLYTAQETF